MKNIQEEFNSSVPVFSLKKSLVVTEKTSEGMKHLQLCRWKDQTCLLKWCTTRWACTKREDFFLYIWKKNKKNTAVFQTEKKFCVAVPHK